MKRKPYASRYPWDLWFGRSAFSLSHGRDFFCLVHGMVGMLRNAARLRGQKIKVRVSSTTKIEVKVIKDEKGAKNGVLNGSNLHALRR